MKFWLVLYASYFTQYKVKNMYNNYGLFDLQETAIKTIGVHNRKRIFLVYCRVGLHMPSQFFCDDHDSTSFEAVFSFHVNKHGNWLRLLFLH